MESSLKDVAKVFNVPISPLGPTITTRDTVLKRLTERLVQLKIEQGAIQSQIESVVKQMAFISEVSDEDLADEIARDIKMVAFDPEVQKLAYQTRTMVEEMENVRKQQKEQLQEMMFPPKRVRKDGTDEKPAKKVQTLEEPIDKLMISQQLKNMVQMAEFLAPDVQYHLFPKDTSLWVRLATELSQKRPFFLVFPKGLIFVGNKAPIVAFNLTDVQMQQVQWIDRNIQFTDVIAVPNEVVFLQQAFYFWHVLQYGYGADASSMAFTKFLKLAQQYLSKKKIISQIKSDV